MSVTIAEVEAAVRDGHAFPCAMCVHHWQAKKLGQPSCGRATCGGPLSGRTFPDYKGPLPDGDWTNFCFVTGRPDRLVGVQVVGGKRRLAVAREHAQIFEQCTPLHGAIDCTPYPVLLIENGAARVGADPATARGRT